MAPRIAAPKGTEPMGLRGELFTTKAIVSNRSYFFNVKENRLGDLFMTLVESKQNEGEGFDRHQVVVFADDLKEFLSGFDESLRFMEREASKRRRSKPDGRPGPERRGSAERGPSEHRGSDEHRGSSEHRGSGEHRSSERGSGERRDGERSRVRDAAPTRRDDGTGARAKYLKRKDGKPFRAGDREAPKGPGSYKPKGTKGPTGPKYAGKPAHKAPAKKVARVRAIKKQED